MRPPDPQYTDQRRRVLPAEVGRLDERTRRLDAPPALTPEPGGMALQSAAGLAVSPPLPPCILARILSGPYVLDDPHRGSPELPPVVGYAFEQLIRPPGDGEAPAQLIVHLDGVAAPGPPGTYPVPTPPLAGMLIENSGNQYVPIGVVVRAWPSDDGRAWECEYPVPGGPHGPVLPPSHGPPTEPFAGPPPPGTAVYDVNTGAVWVYNQGYVYYGFPPSVSIDGSLVTQTITNALTQNFGGNVWTVNAFNIVFDVLDVTDLTVTNLTVTGTTSFAGVVALADGSTVSGNYIPGYGTSGTPPAVGRVPYVVSVGPEPRFADSAIRATATLIGLGLTPTVYQIETTGSVWFGGGFCYFLNTPAAPRGAVGMPTSSEIDLKVIGGNASGLAINDTSKRYQFDCTGHDGELWVNGAAIVTGTTVNSSALPTLDALQAPAADVSMASHKLTNLATGTGGTDAVNKNQLDAAVAGLLDLKGATDCSANPNYPAASKGDTYLVSVAGKVGGASGKPVDVGDVYIASADNAGGTEAAVGASWFVMEHNLQGVLQAANNLSDVASVSSARTNLGLGTAATKNTGTSGATVPLLNDNLVWSGQNTFGNNLLFIKDAGGSFSTQITFGSTLTATRGLTITTGDADRTVTLSGDLTVSAAATVSGTNTGDQTVPAAATQAEEEAASSTTAYTSPGRQKYHPGVCKAWIDLQGTGTPAANASYNVGSITDNGVGNWAVNWTAGLSSANYCVVATVYGHGDAAIIAVINNSGSNLQATGSTVVNALNTALALVDCRVMLAVYGDM